jgi:hypothetical protein
MRPDPKYVIDLATKLDSARETVARLEQLWDSLFLEIPAIAVAAAPANHVERNMRTNSAISRTLDFINAHPDEVYDSSELSGNLGIPIASTRTNLAKLYKDGKVRKVRDGVYASLLQEKGQEKTPA